MKYAIDIHSPLRIDFVPYIVLKCSSKCPCKITVFYFLSQLSNDLLPSLAGY